MGNPVKFEDVASGAWDWKANPEEVAEGTVSSINVILKKLGIRIFCYEDPACDVMDTPGFIFSLRKLTKKQVKLISKKGWGM